jgi:hypothetical protein
VVTGVEAGGRYGYEAYASKDPSEPVATPAGAAPPNA